MWEYVKDLFSGSCFPPLNGVPRNLERSFHKTSSISVNNGIIFDQRVNDRLRSIINGKWCEIRVSNIVKDVDGPLFSCIEWRTRIGLVPVVPRVIQSK